MRSFTTTGAATGPAGPGRAGWTGGTGRAGRADLPDRAEVLRRDERLRQRGRQRRAPVEDAREGGGCDPARRGGDDRRRHLLGLHDDAIGQGRRSDRVLCDDPGHGGGASGLRWQHDHHLGPARHQPDGAHGDGRDGLAERRDRRARQLVRPHDRERPDQRQPLLRDRCQRLDERHDHRQHDHRQRHGHPHQPRGRGCPDPGQRRRQQHRDGGQRPRPEHRLGRIGALVPAHRRSARRPRQHDPRQPRAEPGLRLRRQRDRHLRRLRRHDDGQHDLGQPERARDGHRRARPARATSSPATSPGAATTRPSSRRTGRS